MKTSVSLPVALAWTWSSDTANDQTADTLALLGKDWSSSRCVGPTPHLSGAEQSDQWGQTSDSRKWTLTFGLGSFKATLLKNHPAFHVVITVRAQYKLWHGRTLAPALSHLLLVCGCWGSGGVEAGGEGSLSPPPCLCRR